MQFEFDEFKSRVNARKHGIDFVRAQAIWLDEMYVEIPARFRHELRHMVIGVIRDRCWTAIIAYRGENVRLISVRRSRQEEEAIYEGRGIRPQV